MLLRQLASIVALPGTVTIAIPLWIASRNRVGVTALRSPADVFLVACGVVLLLAGLIPLLEEPILAARFGEPYDRYKRAVRRFLPRLRPWTPP